MSKIVIEEGILKNWGPYYGEHKINFSVNPTQNVTYFLGKNSTGKTKIFEAINWAFFIDKDKEYNLSAKINTEAKKEAYDSNTLLETRVELKFRIIDEITSDEQKYHIRRFFKYDRKIKKPEFFGSWTENTSKQPNILEVNDFKLLIDDYIPKGPREFYFLDGEKLVLLFKINIEVVKDLTIKQSIVPILEQMLRGLRIRKDEIIKRMKAIGKKNDNLKKWTDNLSEITNKLNNVKDEKEKLNNDKLKFVKKIAEIEKKLIDVEPGIKTEIDELENKIKELEIKLTEISKDILKFLERSATHILLEDIYIWCLNDLKDKQQNGIIPSFITEEVINEIIKMPSCVCGHALNNEELEKLKEYKVMIPKGDVNEAVIEFRSWLNRRIEQSSEDKILLRNLNEDKKVIKIDLEKFIEQKKVKDRSTSEEILTLIENLESLNKRINEFDYNINKKDEELNDIEKEVETANRMIKKLKTELEKTLSKDIFEEITELTQEKDIIDELEKIIENIKEDTIEFIRKYVEKRTSEKYLKFIWNSKEWKGIVIDDNWNFYAIQKNDIPIESPELSRGQRHVLAISYMSSLPLVTRIDLPFLFDSPFGGISEEPIQFIGKFLPQILKGSQIIIFVTDTEHKSVHPYIESKIGNNYTISYKNNRAQLVNTIDLTL